jgi:hypothetical protein
MLANARGLGKAGVEGVITCTEGNFNKRDFGDAPDATIGRG